MEDILKNRINNFYKLINIEKYKLDPTSKLHTIVYVDLSFRRDKSPIFTIKYTNIDITVEIRDSVISELLYSEKPDEKVLKLKNPLNGELNRNSNRSNILESKIQWANQFRIGDRVYYKGEHGIISFKHQMKSHRQPQEWSVICNGIEHKYVTGALLAMVKEKLII
jgi:hypothetical protein